MCTNVCSNLLHWFKIFLSKDQCRPMLRGIDPYWLALIFIEKHLDQCLKFDDTLIHINGHCTLIHHVLKRWRGFHVLDNLVAPKQKRESVVLFNLYDCIVNEVHNVMGRLRQIRLKTSFFILMLSSLFRTCLHRCTRSVAHIRRRPLFNIQCVHYSICNGQ